MVVVNNGYINLWALHVLKKRVFVIFTTVCRVFTLSHDFLLSLGQ